MEEENTTVQQGKRKVQHKDNWKKEVKKKKRLSGQGYVMHDSAKYVDAKEFCWVKKCCSSMCYDKVDVETQHSFYDTFWKSESKNVQDTLLSSCIQKRSQPERNRNISNPKVNRENTWMFSIPKEGTFIGVCRQFLLQLLQVSVKRLRVVQSKVLQGDTFEERRGTHANRPHKLEDQVVELMASHLHSIPHKKSHYCQHKTETKYFDNPNLNVKKLHELFRVYYQEKTGNRLKMQYKTYFRYFRERHHFSFRHPKTDVCDFCVRCEMKLKADPSDPCKLDYILHKKKAARYKEIKSKYISDAKNNAKCLVIEFDYSQNLPLPKLNVTSQFYKRLLWLYLFNIHVHNDGSSYIFCFMENH